MRTTLAALTLLATLALFAGTALAQSDDPFADEDDAAADDESSDPFATYEQRRNESFAAESADASRAASDADAPAASDEAASDASTPAAAADAGGKDTPGLGLLGVGAALGAAMLVLRRK